LLAILQTSYGRGQRKSFLPYKVNWPTTTPVDLTVRILVCMYTTLVATDMSLRQSRSHFTTDSQSVSMSWYRAPLWDLRPGITSCRNVAV
jgi:hypothetical protein